MTEANVLMVSGLVEGSRDNCHLGEPLEAVSYQRGSVSAIVRER